MINKEEFSEHLPVMPEEVLEWLNLEEGMSVLDGTLGLGGHSSLIAGKIGASGHLVGLDRDENAIAQARLRLQSAPCRVDICHYRYSEMLQALAGLGLSGVDGVLLDIGVSSMQLDRAERGFSFMRDGPLDMRMDTSTGITAADIIMNYGEEELARIFYEYGEERFSRKIAGMIVACRKQARIESTLQLAKIIEKAVPRRGKIHPATRSFQGLRIEVNQELKELEEGIAAAVSALNPGGRFVLLTFHSLEDRLAKYRMREIAEKGLVRLTRKKVVKPAYEECRVNRRARSAKLRVVEKI